MMKEEEYFVKTFIRKERQERLIHELGSPKKRYRGLDRFSHQCDELIDPDVILMKDGNLENCADFQKFIRENDGMCTLLSPDPSLDGLNMLFSEAVEKAAFSSEAVIIVEDSYCAVFSEAMKGSRDKYLLKKRNPA